MSFGNCCLVSDIPECAEVIEDKAVLFEHGNEAQLQEKMQLLCDDPTLVERYRAGAIPFICSKYSWDDVAQRTLELYEEKDK